MKNQIEELKTIILMQFVMGFSIIYDSSDNSHVFVKVLMNFKIFTKIHPAVNVCHHLSICALFLVIGDVIQAGRQQNDYHVT